MKIMELLGTASIGLSTLFAPPAIAATDAVNIMAENPPALTADVADPAQDEMLLATHISKIVLVNNSTIDVAYQLDGVSYRLTAGMQRTHFFYYYGDGDRYINFDFSSSNGWQNQTYNLDLDSYYVFNDLGYGLVDLF